MDLDAETLQVNRTLSLGSFTVPKTAKSRRNVKLTSIAIDALRKHLSRQLAEVDRAGSFYQDAGLVFATNRGTPLSRHNIHNRSFKPLLKQAELPDIRFHDLRHTCATSLLSRGVHPKFVQELLGHANIAVTLDTYSHVLPGMGDQTSKAMEDSSIVAG